MLRPVLLCLLVFSLLFYAIAVVIGCAPASQPKPQQPYVPAEVLGHQNPTDLPPDPLLNLPPKVVAAIQTNNLVPIHMGITTMFPYDPHSQPTINCLPMHVTQIILASNETIDKNGVAAGDVERWPVGIVGNQLMIKPTDAGISTNLVVATNHRTYQFLLRTRQPYMPQVSFYYPDEISAQLAARKKAAQAVKVDDEPRLNFDYSITGAEVPWKPLRAFDDTQHVYIQFPDNTLGTDMPVLYTRQGEQDSLINYEVRGSYYVADKIFSHGVLTQGTGTNRQVVEITAEGR